MTPVSCAPVRLALVGCGSFGRHLASKAAGSSEAAIIACHDPEPSNARLASGLCGASVEATLGGLLSRSDIDGVIIVTPNHLHREVAVAALDAGKHVFIEKPIANTLDDAMAIVERSKSRRRTLAVGHNGRRKSGHRAMKALIDGGALGSISWAEANFSRPGAGELSSSSWRFSRLACPALPLTQLGIHHIDTLRYLLGDVSEVASLMSRMVIPGDNMDNTATLLRFRSGVLATIVSSYTSAATYSIRVSGTGGTLLCEQGHSLVHLDTIGKRLPDPVIPPVDDVLEEIDDFARCIRNGGDPEVGGNEAIEAVRILESALHSATDRRAVAIGAPGS